ncbi:hypothetical protein ONZ51_g259 [Trametes cubensis]|uniref:Uncharacterized protein n=1 Tax=Trametes cubensis TaxID=1111947 RepID=A0AAD7U3L0_9APHY|nr:hypothetical protein ONZ51_g259 [Trametes cubensis]
MRRAPSQLEDAIAHAEQGIKHEAHEVGEKAKEAGEAAMHALSPQQSSTGSGPEDHEMHREGAGTGGSEEDEGWMSDQSAGEPSGASGKGRNKSPKLKIPKPKINVARPAGTRRRTSMRRGVLGQRPQVIQRSQSEDFSSRRQPVAEEADEDADDGRGRSSALRPPAGSRHPSGMHTPQHRRIDSIRSVTQSREMSPARSVRFADEAGLDRGGLATPRLLSPTGPSTPTATAHGSEAETEEDDSPRSQVRFSLPSGQEVRQA